MIYGCETEALEQLDGMEGTEMKGIPELGSPMPIEDSEDLFTTPKKRPAESDDPVDKPKKQRTGLGLTRASEEADGLIVLDAEDLFTTPKKRPATSDIPPPIKKEEEATATNGGDQEASGGLVG